MRPEWGEQEVGVEGVGAEVMGPRGFNQGFLTPAFMRVQEEGNLGTTHGSERPRAQVPAPLLL